ncbi:MAG: hypothetical protein OEZ58_19520, partial [Gammaproteobacteria bacterium]|nr:hypothetical protein [Gammaproteobacteria bacterium]
NLYQNVTLLEIEEPDLEVVDITGEPVNNASRPSSEPAQRTVEVELPCLDPVVWQNWWQAHQGRFDTTQRWRHGYPITQSRLVNELNQPQVVYQKRQLVYFELLIRFQINISFEADWFMTKQVSALEAMQSPIMVTN